MPSFEVIELVGTNQPLKTMYVKAVDEAAIIAFATGAGRDLVRVKELSAGVEIHIL